MVFSLSRWNVIEIPPTGEMACSMFIASSKSLLNDSSVVLGLSRIYRELVLIFVEVSSMISCFVFSGVALSRWISVHIISSEEFSDGVVSGNGFGLPCGVTAG